MGADVAGAGIVGPAVLIIGAVAARADVQTFAQSVAVGAVPPLAGGPDPAKRSEGGRAVTPRPVRPAASVVTPLAIEDDGPPARGGTGRPHEPVRRVA